MTSAFMSPRWDKGIFKMGGEFEYLYDERPNSLSPQINIRDKYNNMGERVPRFTQKEIKKLIDNATNRANSPPNRLEKLTKAANFTLRKKTLEERIVNIPFSSIIQNTGLAISNILIDLSNFFSFNGSQNSFLDVFIKNDRMIYLGVFMLFIYVLITLIFYFDK